MELILSLKIICCIIAIFIVNIYYASLDQPQVQTIIDFISTAYFNEITDNSDKICGSNYHLLKFEYLTKPVCDCYSYNQTILIGNSCKSSNLTNCQLIPSIGIYNITIFTFEYYEYQKLFYVCYQKVQQQYNLAQINEYCYKPSKNYNAQQCLKNLRTSYNQQKQNNTINAPNQFPINLSTDTFVKSLNFTTTNKTNSIFQLIEEQLNSTNSFTINATKLTSINQINIQFQTLSYILSQENINLTQIYQDTNILDHMDQILYFNYEFDNSYIAPLLYLIILLIILNIRFKSIPLKIAENFMILISFALCFLMNKEIFYYLDNNINPFIDERIDKSIRRGVCFLYIYFVIFILSLKQLLQIVLLLRYVDFCGCCGCCCFQGQVNPA